MVKSSSIFIFRTLDVFSSIRQDILDQGYMDKPDAVYVTFHTIELGKLPQAMFSLMFPSLRSCQSCGSLAFSWNARRWLSAPGRRECADVAKCFASSGHASHFRNPFESSVARLRFLLSDQTLAATCCYAIKIPMIPHIALEGLVFCRMMFRNVVGWPAVTKAGNGGPVTFLCQQFCVEGDICRIVSDPSLSDPLMMPLRSTSSNLNMLAIQWSLCLSASLWRLCPASNNAMLLVALTGNW